VHPYLRSQLAIERHQDMISRASRERLAREAAAARRTAQPGRRARLGIHFPLRLTTRMVA
jgi:hypothetical protein